jgi:hypothetical protein
MQAQNCEMRIAGETVGLLHDMELDWPWFRGNFSATPAFQPYVNLFHQCDQTQDPHEKERLMAEILALDIEMEGQMTGERFTSRAGRAGNGQIARLFLNQGSFRMRLLIK